MSENNNKEKRWRKAKRFIAGLLAGTFIGTIGTYLATRKKVSNNQNKENSSMVDNKETLSENIKFEVIEPTTTKETIAAEPVKEKKEILTTKRFETLVADFSKPYVKNNINVTTEDLVKFVSIVNIDELAEENPDLAEELFSAQKKEEYLNDAAKVIGMTYMYNHKVYTEENSTKNFINVSDAVHDEEQKQKIEKIEDYVTKISLKTNNEEELNNLVLEFLESLSDPQSELSYLDDGVGFGMQVDIALILNSIARNYLNQENRDWLQELTSSEKYVSNIFRVYEGCSTNSYTSDTAYTRTRTK